MPPKALIYAWTINAVGIAILTIAILQWHTADVLAFGICLALAAFASTQKVKLPLITGTVSPGFVFLLVSVATLTWSETVLIAVVSGLIQLPVEAPASAHRPANRL